ncbi:CTTNBP2 N-terminal-like protein [Phymastichus coffea]|uniref:CTTNBP2 N-terminal-like protein n=1 Tax=Phymastichus coffea TaxID=108790 RepID=UPI00273C022D|nr:CTTNBP2 N-terminal-like protein [Phymastichus coffea]
MASSQGPSAAAAAAANGPPSVVVKAAEQQANNFEPLDKSSNTLKRNPKMELCKNDLLKLLGYLEGELQARDVVIAALKSEKVKHLLNSKYRCGTSDPQAALARDQALIGGPSCSQGNQIDQLGATLEALVSRQRYMKSHMVKVLNNAEFRHRTVIKELEEEKQKHEHDTAQGDDITYGLEKERTRLKKELEMEKKDKKRIEMEAKRILVKLLEERKKIMMKYIEERKRSEDLAQILSEEKVRTDAMAEGLEEESKKSLHMEAEMEKQQAQFDIERSQFRQTTASKDKKLMEQSQEIERLKVEIETLKEQLARGQLRTIGVTPPPPPAKPANLAAMPTLRPAGAPAAVKGAVLGAGTPMVSSKVVQPTATVSSVPVSGPTTGIARSVTPGQVLRGASFGHSEVVAVTLPQDVAANATTTTGTVAAPGVQALHKRPSPIPTPTPAAATVGTTVSSGGVLAAAAAKKPIASVTPSAVAAAARGAPPPVPPNKPVVPPKKEVAAAFLRKASEQSVDSPTGVKQFVKQNTVIANPNATSVLQNQQQQPLVTADEEAKSR